MVCFFPLRLSINPLLEQLVHTCGGKAGYRTAQKYLWGYGWPVHPYRQRDAQNRDAQGDEPIIRTGEVLEQISCYQTQAHNDGNKKIVQNRRGQYLLPNLL